MDKNIELYQRRLGKNIVLDSGEIDGVSYIIKTIQGHYPTAYISAHYTEDFEDIATRWGVGITYSTEEYGSLPGLDEERAWVGWDYGHGGDYICADSEEYDIKGHRYSYAEIMEDVKDMIKLAKELELEN